MLAKIRTLLFASCLASCGGGNLANNPPSPAAAAPSQVPAAAAANTGSSLERICTGALTPQISEAVQRQAHTTRVCYEAALVKEPTLSGRLVLELTIEQGGGLSEFAVAEDQLGRPEVIECVQRKFFEASALFDSLKPDNPSPQKDGCLKLKLPLRFAPQTRDVAPPDSSTVPTTATGG